jgi:hypothetical protein
MDRFAGTLGRADRCVAALSAAPIHRVPGIAECETPIVHSTKAGLREGVVNALASPDATVARHLAGHRYHVRPIRGTGQRLARYGKAAFDPR